MALSIYDFPLLKWAWNLAQWITSPISMISTSLIAGLGSIFVVAYDAFTSAFGILGSLVSFIASATSVVTSFVHYLTSLEWFSFLAHIFALDIFSSCLTWFIGLWAATLILMAFGLVFASISAVLPFFILRSLRSIVSICSGGFLKP